MENGVAQARQLQKPHSFECFPATFLDCLLSTFRERANGSQCGKAAPLGILQRHGTRDGRPGVEAAGICLPVR